MATRSFFVYPSSRQCAPLQRVVEWEKQKKGNFNDSPTSAKEGLKMAKCLDCCNLIKSWIPTTKPDWLFDERWKCKVTSESFEMYYLVEKERECKHYERRQSLN